VNIQVRLSILAQSTQKGIAKKNTSLKAGHPEFITSNRKPLIL